MKMKVGTNMTVKRGKESWAYIYVMLGFALAIEATVITMITPLIFPWNLIAFAMLGATTFWLFIDNRWVQNKLIQMKIRYEDKGR